MTLERPLSHAAQLKRRAYRWVGHNPDVVRKLSTIITNGA